MVEVSFCNDHCHQTEFLIDCVYNTPWLFGIFCCKPIVSGRIQLTKIGQTWYADFRKWLCFQYMDYEWITVRVFTANEQLLLSKRMFVHID